MKQIVVDERFSKERLNKYLSGILPNASMGFIYKMLRKKNIVLNGRKAQGNELLSAGDEIKIFFSDDTFDKFSRREAVTIADAKPLTVLYEDNDVIAVHKPAGLLSQSDRAGGDCVNARIISYLAQRKELLPDFTPSIVNRLDRNTSGIVLAGKTYQGVRALTEEIRERRIIKTYKCICEGDFPEEGTVTAYLKEIEGNQVRVFSSEVAGSKRIITEFIPERRLVGFTLLRVILHTGRKHQIRAQLAALNHPVAGDAKYGRGKGTMYLHAYSVDIPEIGTITDPLPDDFTRFINAHL